jgi:two-component system chemotaxis response regulator CheY
MTKIMIVDDSAMVRRQVGAALTGAGYTTIDAIDGVDAFTKLEAATDTALIVCDLNMPRMNGLEFLELITKDTRYAQLPLVMLTTEGQPELIQRARSLGAKGWLVKPFKPDLLLAVAKKFVGARP